MIKQKFNNQCMHNRTRGITILQGFIFLCWNIGRLNVGKMSMYGRTPFGGGGVINE